MSRCVAVVGAGISGLSCAHELRAAGHKVVVVDKSRGPSGRMSTRRHDLGSFDHGAQYFTARSDSFRRVVAKWEAAGSVAAWNASFGRLDAKGWSSDSRQEPRWVGTPSMSAICRAMSSELDTRFGTRVSGMTRHDRGWLLKLEDGSLLGPYDALALSCPTPQAAQLLAGHPTGLSTSVASGNAYQGTWALMLGFDRRINAPYDGMTLDNNVLSWAARDSSKPRREPGERWVLHASSAWSEAHIEDAPSDVVETLSEAFARHADVSSAKLTVAVAHRWRYARSTALQQPSQAWQWDPANALGLCGDGRGPARVESAWASGVGLGRQMAQTR